MATDDLPSFAQCPMVITVWPSDGLWRVSVNRAVVRVCDTRVDACRFAKGIRDRWMAAVDTGTDD